MRDEWNADQLDLDAYLARVGYAGPTSPDAGTLTALHRAHVAAVPFENLDVVLGRGVSVQLGDVQDKLVGRRRGGYCYEHNLLFAAALERLGFAVRRLLARVGAADPPGPRSHLALVVQIGGTHWLADVGFGSGLLEPVPFDGVPHHQGGWTYRLVAQGDRCWQLQECHASGWATVYGFAEEQVHAADVVAANHFTSTWSRSPFVRQLVAVRKDDYSVHRLLGRTLSSTRPDGHAESEQILTDAQVPTALREVFDLRLSDDEEARLLTSLAVPAGAA